jgi:outer membrane immunogenic protein
MRIGRSVAAGVLALHAGVGATLAADIAAPANPTYNWTGFYAGLNAGWSRADVDGRNSVPCSATCAYFMPANADGINAGGRFGGSDDAFTGGLQIGYNWHAGNWVFGLEGDFNALHTKMHSTILLPYATAPFNGTRFDNSIETEWLATLRGRLGVASLFEGKALLYVTGGAAFTQIETLNTTAELNPFPTGIDCALRHCAVSSVDSTKAGWTLGGGAEWALNRNWSIKTEYLYADFGTVRTTSSYAGANGATEILSHDVDLSLHIARAGINYKF